MTHRLTDMENEFGLDYTQIDRVFNVLVEHVVAVNYMKLFDKISYFVSRFPMYNTTHVLDIRF